MDRSIEFNNVTYGLPLESFRVDAYIALEERLPVVTEYVLRLLRVCGHLPLLALRTYFGFTESEALSIVESLARQGLVALEDDEVRLSPYSSEKFEQSGDGHPRFSKVELRQDTVHLDLMTFAPIKSVSRDNMTDNVVKLEASNEHIGQSIDRARIAYRQRYAEIASMREDLRERSFGVYSVESIESKRRSYLGVPVSFRIDEYGNFNRDYEQEFGTLVPDDLLQKITEQVTGSIPQQGSEGDGLAEFIQMFELSYLSRYLVGRKFNLNQYLDDVHFSKTAQFPKWMAPIIGNLYLPSNVDRVVARLRPRRTERGRPPFLFSSLAWLAPDYALWGRGSCIANAVKVLRRELSSGNSGDLYLCTYADQGQEIDVTSTFRIDGLKELHFARPGASGKPLGGRLEIMLYPTAFVVALYHLSVPGMNGVWLPIGFTSNNPKHLALAHKLLRATLGGSNYGGRARFTQQDSRASPLSFDEAMPFLNYEEWISNKSVSDTLDEEAQS